MKEFADMHRPLAAEAYVAKKGVIPTATAEFLTRCQNLEIKAPRDAASFVERWGQRWVEDGSIEGHGSNSGRKRMLSLDDGQLVVGYLKKGRADADGGVYGSIRELRQECPEVDEMLQARGASDSTVERAVHYECPEMVFGDLVVKPKYTCKQLNDRYSTAAGHLETFTTSFRVGQRVIWIDAKTMPMQVNSKKGWFIPSEKDTFETTLPTNLKQPLVLKYYIAVNYLLGALELVFYTGTTGMPADRNPGAPYKVSSAMELHRLVLIALYLHVAHCALDGPAPLLPPVGLSVRSLHPEPHHTVTCCLGCSCQCCVPADPVSQACISIVSLSVKLAAVLLALHLNQHLARF